MAKDTQLELKFHPAAENPARAWLLAGFIGFMGGVMFFVLNSPLVVGLLLFMMIYSLVPFFFPTYYRFDSQGITMKRTGKEHAYSWDDYRSFTIQDNGIVIWAEVSVPNANDGFRKRMSALRRSVFFPMTPEMIGQAERILRQKLALTKEAPASGSAKK
ncbi:hypothetical protein IJT17_05185 [bacterium]|nr:hypothetical protein [bacterium]